MGALDNIKAKFWSTLGARGVRMNELARDAANGDERAHVELASLVHMIKGEAQMLSLEPCARVLERTDQLVKSLSRHGYAPSAATALSSVTALLQELGRTSGASSTVDATLRLIDAATLDASTVRHS